MSAEELVETRTATRASRRHSATVSDGPVERCVAPRPGDRAALDDNALGSPVGDRLRVDTDPEEL